MRGQKMDPTEMLAEVAAIAEARNIEILRVDNAVRFTAAQADALPVLAVPLAAWWQRHGPTTAGDVALRFVGPNGGGQLTYCVPDIMVELVRHTIEVESGRLYEPGEAPGMAHRLAARLLRGFRAGFTACELVVREQDEVVCVSLAGREVDDRPRSVEFQGYNPDHEEYDLDDDEGYCLVNEDHVPVYGGLVLLHLRGQTLKMRLTGEAAWAWGMRRAGMTVRLRLGEADLEQLRTGLRRVLTSGRAGQSMPELDLG